MSEAKKLAEYLGFEVVYLDGFGYIQEEGEQGPEIKREANLEERTMWTDLVRLSAELAALKAATFTVLEGFTLPHDVRKILESAFYAIPKDKP